MPINYIYLSQAYLNVSDCVMHIWPIPVVCNDIPRHIPEHDWPYTYIHTLITSSIQSLVLRRLAINL